MVGTRAARGHRSPGMPRAGAYACGPMPTVALDARDAVDPRARGWGRYARGLVDALLAGAGGDGLDYRVIARGARGPEVLWEQVGLPWLLRRERVALVHVPQLLP